MSERLMHDEWDQAYAAGIDAARQAVAELQVIDDLDIPALLRRVHVLAAIDGLRGES